MRYYVLNPNSGTFRTEFLKEAIKVRWKYNKTNHTYSPLKPFSWSPTAGEILEVDIDLEEEDFDMDTFILWEEEIEISGEKYV